MKWGGYFLFFCTVFVVTGSFAQNKPQNEGSFLHFAAAKKTGQNVFSLSNQSDGTLQNISVLPSDFYAVHLGFFCKEEIKFQKTTSIPFRFRLGSVDECDELEGKKNNQDRTNFSW
jgi:hypothetical protein